jgi:hypothetical protein
MRNFRDTFNAYPSILHTAILDPLDAITEPYLHDPITDHIQHNVFCITTPDDVRFFRADSGVVAGSSLGTDLFNISAWPAPDSLV